MEKKEDRRGGEVRQGKVEEKREEGRREKGGERNARGGHCE